MTMNRRKALTALGATVATGLLSHTTSASAAPKKRGKKQTAKSASRAATAIVGATLLRGDAPPLANSVVVFEGKTITYVGTDRTMTGEGRVIQAQGKTLTAGLVDPLTRIGLTEVSLESSTRDDAHRIDHPIRAAFRASDGYNPASSLVRITRREGLTSVGVVPTGGLVTGQSAWANLSGKTPAQALHPKSVAVHVRLHDGWIGDRDASRGSSWLELRRFLDDSLSFKKNAGAYRRRDLRALGASRLDYRAMLPVLDAKVPLVVHVDRASDIMTAIDVAKSYGLRLVLASAAEAWKVRRAIRDAGVPVIAYVLDEGPRTFAALGAREDNPALLARAGVRVALSTGESHNARKLRQGAGNAIRAGLSRRAAISAVTDEPARIFGLESEYGTPKAGRFANLALWTGDPFELSTHAERLFIHGKQVSLKSRHTALYERYAK